MSISPYLPRTRCKKFILASLAFVTAWSCSGMSWVRNTYPGPGHVANSGPWGEGQGSDRAEWVSYFAVSPVNPNFMLQGTDLGRLIYTNTRLGGTEFVPAELPLHKVASLAFHPTDPNTAYALMMEDEMPGAAGWWRTEDEGETWSQMYLAIAPSRGQKRLLVVDPSNGDIYIGLTFGIVRSTDNGATWSFFGGFTGQSIKCLAMAADGSSLYIIPGSQDYALVRTTDANTRGGAEVWRIDNGDPATKVKVIDASDFPGTTSPFFDIDVDPSDGSKGVVVVGDDLYSFTSGGTSQSLMLTGNDMVFARYNPNNANHLICVCSRPVSEPQAFRWSTDGGTNWNSWADTLDPSATTISSLVDYGPWNWRTPGYEFEKVSSITGLTYTFMEDRILVDFVPEAGTANDATVVLWATNFGKAPLKSTDFGATFQPFAHGGSFKRPAQISYGSTEDIRAVAITEHGFNLTNDGGKTWRLYNQYNAANIEPPTQDAGTRPFESRSAWGVAFDPDDDQTLVGIYGYAPANILRTEDFGANWTVVGEWRPYIPAGTAIYADGNIYWHRQNTNIIYAGNKKSTDGGLSFPTTMDFPVSAMSITDGDIVVSKVSTNEWQYSDDAGNNWVQLPNSPFATDGKSRIVADTAYKAHAIDPDPPAGTFRMLSGGEGGVWEYLASAASPETGTWSKVSTTVFDGDPYVDSEPGIEIWTYWVKFDPRPGFSDVVYCSSGPPPANKDRGEMLYRQVYRSTDSGVTWTRQAGGSLQGELPDYLLPTAAGISPSGEFSLGDYAGLYTLRKTGLDDFLEAAFGPDWVTLGYGGGATDVDGDGLIEAFEYMLDTDPLVSDRGLAAQRLQQSISSGKNRLTLAQTMGKSGILVSAEVGDDLLNWDSGPSFVTETVSPDTPSVGWQETVFEDTITLTPGSARFIRLNVEVVD